ncbi:MAG: hypothetical protein R3C03_03635 [Pirellulaceae bacterium]
MTFVWDAKSAFDNIGPVVDSYAGEGVFDATLESLKTDIKVNLPDMADALAGRFTIVSSTKRPIDERSEQIAVIVELKSDKPATPEFLNSLARWSRADVLNDGFGDYLLVQKEEISAGDDIEIDIRFGDIEVPQDEDEFEEEPHEFHLFEKRYFAIRGNNLIVANNVGLLREIVEAQEDGKLGAAADYLSVESALGKFVNWSQVGARQFGRIANQLETNYEMMRMGHMGTSQTALARVLNEVFRTEESTDEDVREQEIDGSQLPSDYAGIVAPMLGLSGWALETQPDGWLLSGCVIKKKVTNNVVQKQNDNIQR